MEKGAGVMDEVRGVGARIGQEFGELIGGLVARQEAMDARLDEINARLDAEELVLTELLVLLHQRRGAL